MAAVARSHAPPAPRRRLTTLWLGLARVRARWQAYRRLRRELRDLSAFNDRELRDIGLSRSDLMSIENGTFRRR